MRLRAWNRTQDDSAQPCNSPAAPLPTSLGEVTLHIHCGHGVPPGDELPFTGVTCVGLVKQCVKLPKLMSSVP